MAWTCDGSIGQSGTDDPGQGSPTIVWNEQNKKTQKTILSCQFNPHLRKQRHIRQTVQEIWRKEWGFYPEVVRDRDRDRDRLRESMKGICHRVLVGMCNAFLPTSVQVSLTLQYMEGQCVHHPAHNPVIMWVTEMPNPGVRKLWQAGQFQSAALYNPRAKNGIYIFKVL